MKRSKILSSALALSAATFLMAASPLAIAVAAPAEPHRTVSPAPQRQNLVIYQRGFGIVQQTNTVDVVAGANSIRFEGVSGRYEPSSLMVVNANGVQLRIRDISYQPANLNTQSLLQASVGSVITVKTASGEEVSGTLLSYSEGNLLISATNGNGGPRIVREARDVQLPTMPTNLSATPSLTLNAESNFPASGDLQILYKTAGLSWSARYSLVYNEQRGTVDLTCSAAISNSSGTDFRNAGVRVVSGNVQDVGPAEMRSIGMPMAASAPGGMMADDAAVGSIGEQKIYTLAVSGIELRDGETKQVPLFTQQGVPVDRVFYTRNSHMTNQATQASVRLITTNDPQHRLGQALPGGSARFYSPDNAGQPQLSGSGTVAASEPGDRIFFEMGTSTDIKATWSLTRSTPSPRAPNGTATGPTTNEWTVTLRNSKNFDVQVKVYETGQGNGVRVQSGQQWQQEGGQQFTWVRVPARQEVTFNFTTVEQQ